MRVTLGTRYVNFSVESRVMAVVAKPAGAGVVLHVAQCGVVVFDPDFQGAHRLELLLRHEDCDPLEMVGQHPNRFTARFGMFALEHCRIDVNRPAFDVLFHRIETDTGLASVLAFLSEQRPRSKQGSSERREQQAEWQAAAIHGVLRQATKRDDSDGFSC